MKHADAAMYHVKGSGRAGMCFFSEDLFGKPSRRSELEARLRQALTNKEFVIHYQPLIDLQNGTIYGNEALLRWQDPENGLRAPEDFLSLVEEIGLVLPVGEWVLETACIQARSWQMEGRQMIVAVNLSEREFQRPDLLELVRRVLKMAGLSPQLLELEIGETLAMQDVDYSAGIFQGLRELGVRVAIDDFGTGFSSLAALNRLPITSLKIDGSFVRSCVENPGSRAIVSAIIGTANALGFSIVAEGVETDEQLELLHSLVCERAQGHLFSVPVSGSELREMIAARTVWTKR